MKVLVTGGAGYVGSVVTQRLVEQGADVVVIDNLSHGSREAVHPDAKFVEGDILDASRLDSIFAEESFDAVVHLAALALIDESVRNPVLFYRVNMVGGLNLLDAMRQNAVQRLVFSSTAAVYGEPRRIPVEEDDPHDPVNAYGQSKLAFEDALPWYETAYGLKYVSFRYFNACGATDLYGENRRKETHIIPLLLDVASGDRDSFSLFGTGYDTPDGTCVRDYVHVLDIAQAHLLALEKMDALGSARAFNLGNGNGFSNSEVIAAVREVTGREIPVNEEGPRMGDPACLVASSELARQELGWAPEFPRLEAMIQTAWDWQQKYRRQHSS